WTRRSGHEGQLSCLASFDRSNVSATGSATRACAREDNLTLERRSSREIEVLRVNEIERVLPAHHASGRWRRKVRRAHQRGRVVEAVEQFPPRDSRPPRVVI